MTLVIDTSVAVKWVVEEAGADKAFELIPRSLIAPELFQAEIGNALTKKVRAGELSPEQARLGFFQIQSRVSLVPGASYGSAALDLALSLNHSIYGCYFLAMAEAGGHLLVTADRVFAAKVRATSRGPLVYLLGEDIPDD
ncbi:MAG: type II toxin-antitoxin system VapC family toxin [Alphaproteobacteria bacterium]|nr:type II toxin-antitoxin system VapC family toxin [Alphaproteobacteria bacterium]MBV9372881.1 type II toxin-antitoxin system VapC family toxin [Alphaproteobacteria bacterium]MBV9902069.1 type II toxin-antitoxin system VapC family toxin [Alphaproteobacteria bacterium]